MLAWAAPTAIHELQGVSISSALFAAYLGVFPSATSYALWGSALSIANKSSEVTNYMFVTPMLATLEGILFLKELPTTGTYIGGTIIIVMVILFNLSKK